MKRYLTAFIFSISLPYIAHAGIPQSQNPSKWMQINNTWKIDTEDVEVNNGKLRFFVERRAQKDEFEGPSNQLSSWIGKYRINCDKFEAMTQVRMASGVFGYYASGQWESIRPDTLGYGLANYLCFATGSEGYTRELIEPEWVKKIINNIEIQEVERKKKIGNINCNSPVWKKKPICN